MSNGVGLYYPYIEIRDSDWLKAALLYWDTIRRIVPEPVRPEDSDDVRRAADAGLILDTSPGEYLGDVASRMDGKLESLVLDASAEELQEIRNYASQTSIKPYFYDSLHRNKVSGLFLERLIELGFASPEGDWLGMDRSVLALYMTELATTMSQRIQAPLVTSSPGYASIANASAFGRRWLKAYKDLPTGIFDEVTALVEMNVGFPSPTDVSGCSMSEILEFRRVHFDEMRQFRKTVEETLAGVAGCTDKNAVDDFLQQSSHDFKVAQKQFERSLLEFGIEKLGNVLKFDFKGPALLVAAAGVLHAPVAVAIGGGAALCGIQAFLKYREQRDASPYSYLLTLKTLRD